MKSIRGHLLCLVTALSVSGGVVEQNLNVLNRSDYIAKDTVNSFEQKAGTRIWFDMLAIPADAQNIDEAHEFINYLPEPKVIADIGNYVAYANPNPSSKPFWDEEIAGNTGIHPGEATYRCLYTFKKVDSRLNRVIDPQLAPHYGWQIIA